MHVFSPPSSTLQIIRHTHANPQTLRWAPHHTGTWLTASRLNLSAKETTNKVSAFQLANPNLKCVRSKQFWVYLRVGVLIFRVVFLDVFWVASFIQQLDGERPTQRLRYERVLRRTEMRSVQISSKALRVKRRTHSPEAVYPPSDASWGSWSEPFSQSDGSYSSWTKKYNCMHRLGFQG